MVVTFSVFVLNRKPTGSFDILNAKSYGNTVIFLDKNTSLILGRINLNIFKMHSGFS